ncbi:DoxX family protein [Rhodobacter calidifons]|uniref:DoxX family membrane protein n=1 Tax=Rhodobacter calidifons TaxID=2715277 RepID=A0ABX0G7U2_9RHOB|nr:DoxX family membrane protein [Rhodobacter calidifons]NHB76947.1 DoxX family membrane protein [Rhodobacter calidifons]
MNAVIGIYRALAGLAARQGDWLLPTLARLVFAGVLFGYFWASAMTKLEGLFTPSTGAYAQIFPRAFEAVGYDVGQLGLWHWLVVLAGSWAELALPVLIVLGLLTRLAALGMIGFVLVQSLTDIWGHGAAAGTWFDRASDALILDQRALWLLLFAVLLCKGGGAISADRVLGVEPTRLAA